MRERATLTDRPTTILFATHYFEPLRCVLFPLADELRAAANVELHAYLEGCSQEDVREACHSFGIRTHGRRTGATPPPTASPSFEQRASHSSETTRRVRREGSLRALLRIPGNVASLGLKLAQRVRVAKIGPTSACRSAGRPYHPRRPLDTCRRNRSNSHARCAVGGRSSSGSHDSHSTSSARGIRAD